MSMIPLVLPLKANEAAALADLVYQQLEGNPLTQDLRNRFAARLPQLALETFTPYPGSLARDPIHHSTYYIAIDTQSGPMLLRIALASSPASGLFPSAMLIGRMRPGGGREIVINAVPFNFTDRENVRTFANQVDPTFLPRSQGPQSAIVTGGPDFAESFRAFRAILKSTGLNLAALAGDYDIALWSAIRAGWREGWNAQTSDPSASDYTKYSVEGPIEQLEEIYDRIRAVKSGHVFDFEISTPGDISTALEWMKSRGKPVQFIRVPSASNLREQAAIARQFNAILSFTEGDLEQIGIATAGRFHYRMQGDEEAIRLAASSLLGKTI
ncbi:MAG TPA: hypothetical protein VK752_31615 [Bryobacteraceae bacterium]|jgi:hypothetical protein|nr:hypothetical protein [Bryobacteraceae bacterium]